MTLPQIGDFLGAHGLTLLGFEVNARTLRGYRAAFPDDGLRGVIHAAAAFDVTPLAALEPARLAEIMRPKTCGMRQNTPRAFAADRRQSARWWN